MKTASNKSKSVWAHGPKSLGKAYAILGLQVGESRVDAIRAAARASATSIREQGSDEQECLKSLAAVATSTYRLLDPRKRVRRIERVQLSILSERALELPQLARRSLLDPRPRDTAG